ncbi:MAG: LD-carboxypeptidase [Acidobacteriota bacterium]
MRPNLPFARVLGQPPALRPGDAVAVVSPAGPVDREKLERGLARLEELSLRPRLGRHALDREGYLAGSDDARLSDLEEAIADPGTRAILFSRGGYGLTRIVDRVDLSPLLAAPKIVMGFSDITALHLALAAQADLASFYGPMVASNLGKEVPHARTMTALRIALGLDAGPLLPIDAGSGIRFTGAPARVTAPLAGGCLSLLVASLGTPFEVATAGAILFWEDVGEDLYRIDRMLTHLRLAGKLDDLAGMIAGVPIGITRERREGAVDDLTPFLESWLASSLGRVSFPVVTQFPCSHGEPCVALPLGGLVTIDGAAQRVEIAYR